MRRVPLILGFLIFAAAATGCATSIHAPAAPDDPVNVYVVDYGHHSSLVLPTDSGGALEYAYGEWQWFALRRTSWYRIFPTLFWATGGTLGRRTIAPPLTGPSLQNRIPSERVFALTVNRIRAEALLADLNSRYTSAAREKPVYAADLQLYFVPDGESYHIFHNCNHELAEWLMKLDCRIRGPGNLSNFTVGRPHGRSSE